ncbi:hypothetical protein [Caulobacter segnis]
MRRPLLALLVLTLATPALAGPAAKVVAKPKPVVMASQVLPDTQNYVLPPLVPLASQRPGGDAGQCRASCAKQLYFCGVDGDDGSCGSLYAQCAASCKATYAAPRFR